MIVLLLSIIVLIFVIVKRNPTYRTQLLKAIFFLLGIVFSSSSIFSNYVSDHDYISIEVESLESEEERKFNIYDLDTEVESDAYLHNTFIYNSTSTLTYINCNNNIPFSFSEPPSPPPDL